MKIIYRTVVELPEFEKFAKKHLAKEDRAGLINHLALSPTDGALVKGAGGLRKLRWARPGAGKSGGYRVIYYYHDDEIPVFLITGFAKNEMENISPAAAAEYARILPQIVKAYKES